MLPGNLLLHRRVGQACVERSLELIAVQSSGGSNEHHLRARNYIAPRFSDRYRNSHPDDLKDSATFRRFRQVENPLAAEDRRWQILQRSAQLLQAEWLIIDITP